MAWFRNTKRPAYSTLRAIGREIASQWPERTAARNDVQNLANEPGGDPAWPHDGRCHDSAASERRLGHFLFGR
jgi:hypothetical protein